MPLWLKRIGLGIVVSSDPVDKLKSRLGLYRQSCLPHSRLRGRRSTMVVYCVIKSDISIMQYDV